MKHVYEYYTSAREANARTVRELRRKIHVAGTLRFLLLAACVAVMVAVDGGLTVYGAVFAAFAVPFVWLMVWTSRLTVRKTYAEGMEALNAAELAALDYDFSAFDGAADKADGAHPFSLDLDLFGDRSLFQSLNRTVTRRGRETLTGWFTAPLQDKARILRRQAAVCELAPEVALRQHFYVTGKTGGRQRDDSAFVAALRATDSGFASGVIWRILVWAVPAVWVVLIGLWTAGVVGYVVPTLWFPVSALLAYVKINRVNRLHNELEKAEKVLRVYSRLIAIVEGAPAASAELADIKGRLAGADSPASEVVGQLSRILNALDQRGNMIIAIVNIFILRDMHIVQRFDRWKRANGGHIGAWFGALGDFDALCSLAGFAYNHPDYVYPQLAGEYFEMRGRGLGHPLLHRDVCVRNDIDIAEHPYFMIVTGANMAGKSTYLRTVGVNFLLGCVGAPVCAAELTLYPCSLVTSLRTSDSLTDNESYFYAELKRLKMIIGRLEAGEQLFIILDEILKGTNSVDKQKGSLALIRQFIAHGTCGIIATHDLVLGTLRDEFPAQVGNYRFEADIRGDRLSFSYRMQPGVAENMNAFYLMKKMGITL